MEHLTFVQFFKQAAIKHRLIKHEEVDSKYPDGKRRSFFSGTDYREWQQAENNQVDYPLMHVTPLFGSLTEEGMVYSDRATLKFGIFIDVQNLDDFQAIDAAYNTTKIIALEFLMLIKEDMEEFGYCAALGNVDLSNVNYEFVGPINQKCYGTEITFQSKTDAYDPTQVDIDTLFPN